MYHDHGASKQAVQIYILCILSDLPYTLKNKPLTLYDHERQHPRYPYPNMGHLPLLPLRHDFLRAPSRQSHAP